MKILWLTNVPITKVMNKLSPNSVQLGGWLDGMSELLLKDESVDFYCAFPFNTKDVIIDKVGNVKYTAFPSKWSDDRKQELFENILATIKPDIIHIFGTEFAHTLAMMKACEKLNLRDKAVINIQGLCSRISQHYFANMPEYLVDNFTLRDLIKWDSIYLQKKKFAKRGKKEIEALSLAKHVIGRTDWDRACTYLINRDAKYHFCNATLRPAFYNSKWNYKNCEKHSIFVSQCNYPIKGFHILLQAMPAVLKEFPDAQIYTTGKDLLHLGFKDKLKLSSYEKYLIKLINKNGLANNVQFLGRLNEKDMCDRYLKSNVFVSPSSIENESNSLGESMILGVPSVASFVGGVTTTCVHNQDGYMYPFDEEYMLAYYIIELFKNESLAKEFSKNSRVSANKLFDKQVNYNTLREIYNEIIKG